MKPFFHKLLMPVTHFKRLTTLILLISGVIEDKKLSVTQLGRSIKNNAQEKNNIKRSDRFLSNKKLHEERAEIYRATAVRLIGAQQMPLFLVDWSHVPNTTRYILRAALMAPGRALTIYEEVHPKKLENNPKIHSQFLKKLQAILPKGCCPILVTDAGFCNPWFNSVLAMGWHYIGRVRGNRTFKLQDEGWENYSDTNKTATQKAEYLGEGLLVKSNPLATHFYLIKLPKKYRVRLNKLKMKGHYKCDIEHSKAANEPWLIVSSLQIPASTIIKKYYLRMTIEEAFRDLKSSQFGFSFEKARSNIMERIQILLMIAMLASFYLYLLGWVGEKNNYHYKFQANSIKYRRVLSLFYLGCRIVKKRLEHELSILAHINQFVFYLAQTHDNMGDIL
jgi:hypothetical protein